MPHWQVPPGYSHTTPVSEQLRRSGGGGFGQAVAGSQHTQALLVHSQVRVPYLQFPLPSLHMPPSAGSAGGQYWLPQFQPLAVHRQSALPGEQVMPTTLQLDCSAGTVLGQSLGDQHAH